MTLADCLFDAHLRSDKLQYILDLIQAVKPQPIPEVIIAH